MTVTVYSKESSHLEPNGLWQQTCTHYGRRALGHCVKEDSRKDAMVMVAKVGVIGMSIGMGVGCVLMYCFDPLIGRRRRAYIRNDARSLERKVKRMARSLDKTAHELARLTRNELPGIARDLVLPARSRIWSMR